MHDRRGTLAARSLGIACGLFLALPLSAAGASTHVEVAELGGVSATFAYQESRNRYGGEQTSHLTLAISRGGSVVYSSPIASQWCEMECSPPYRGPDVHLATLEAGHEPIVVLDVYTGGAHCCYVEQTFSGPGANGVTMVEHNFGNGRARLEPLGPEGQDVFVSVDNRFGYAFTDFADSGLPVQVWALSGAVFVNVTRQYPSLISADVAREWRYFKGDRHNDVGFFAAWAADEELLGRGALVSQRLSAELRGGRLRVAAPLERLRYGAGKRFARSLRIDLRRWGYTTAGS